MSFGGLANCPLCWDSPEICRCSQGKIDEYHRKLENEHKQFKQKKREEYHKLLDLSFDKYEKWHTMTMVDDETFGVFFMKEILKDFNEKEWLKLRKAVDYRFKL